MCITRKFPCLFFVAVFSVAGCGKMRLPGFGKKSGVPSPTPTAVAANSSAATPPGATPAAAGTTAAPAAPGAATAPAKAAPIDAKAQVVVLCYHRLEGKAGGTLSIEADAFKKQMQEIKERGLAVISMQDFLAWRRGEKTIPPKSVLITIDDGYLSGYEVGLPVLKEHGYPATFFIYTKFVNSGGKSLTWAQLAELRDAGMEIGCHTVSHQDLRRKPAKAPGDYESWLKEEVETSKQLLEEKLGIAVKTIAYPYGLHNEKVHAACKAAGYDAAFTTYGQRLHMTAPLLALGRFDVTTKDAQGHDSFSVAVGFEGMMAPGGGDGTLAQDAAVAMVTEPANGGTVNTPTPLLKANLASFGVFEPNSVKMRVSGVGEVPSKFDPASKNIIGQLAANQKLRPGPVTVIVTVKSPTGPRDVRWGFHYDPGASAGAGAAGSGAGEQLPPRRPKQ